MVLKVTLALLSLGMVICDAVQNETLSISAETPVPNSNGTTLPLLPQGRAGAFPQYVVITDPKVDFFEAWQTCLSFGYQLASISSPEESFALQQALFRANIPYNGEFWLAGIDLGRFRNFVWITTNRPVALSRYQNWRYGEPNNYGGNERCVEVLNAQDVYWNDVNCAAKLGFICQTEADSGC